MIISNIVGGLGNQMFQYAAGRSLSLRLNLPLFLDISDLTNYKLHYGYQLNHIFRGQFDIANNSLLGEVLGFQNNFALKRILKYDSLKFLRSRHYVIEPFFKYTDISGDISQKAYICGYWQSEKYFKEHAAIIRDDFRFKSELNEINSKISQLILSVNAISIHIRRGDYISSKSTNALLGICPLDYYDAAIKKISSKVSRPHFFIFSDDVEWVKKNLKINHDHYFINHNHGSDSFNDMRLMSMCKHHIIANSNFSWWGAWLNSRKDKIVIAPKNWFKKPVDNRDLIPQTWLTVEV